MRDHRSSSIQLTIVSETEVDWKSAFIVTNLSLLCVVFARYSFVSLTFGTGLMVMVTGVLMDLYTEAKARITILVSIKPFFVLFRRAGVPNLKVGNRN